MKKFKNFGYKQETVEVREISMGNLVHIICQALIAKDKRDMEIRIVDCHAGEVDVYNGMEDLLMQDFIMDWKVNAYKIECLHNNKTDKDFLKVNRAEQAKSFLVLFANYGQMESKSNGKRQKRKRKQTANARRKRQPDLQNKTVCNKTAFVSFRVLETAWRTNVLLRFARVLLSIRIQAIRRKARRKHVVTQIHYSRTGRAF